MSRAAASTSCDEGAGPPLILLHAGIADLRSWDAMVPPLAAAGYRVVRFDARRLWPSTTEDVEFSPRDDLRAVMDALGIGRAVLIGNSRGGMLALDAAIESPERVVAVVGVAAGLAGFDGGSTPAEVRSRPSTSGSTAAGDAAALTAFETTDLGRRSAPAGGPGGRARSATWSTR